MNLTKDYLAGISEGRSIRKLYSTRETILAAAKIDLDFCSRAELQACSSISKDFIRGLRDFWLHQLKIV